MMCGGGWLFRYGCWQDPVNRPPPGPVEAAPWTRGATASRTSQQLTTWTGGEAALWTGREAASRTHTRGHSVSDERPRRRTHPGPRQLLSTWVRFPASPWLAHPGPTALAQDRERVAAQVMDDGVRSRTSTRRLRKRALRLDGRDAVRLNRRLSSAQSDRRSPVFGGVRRGPPSVPRPWSKAVTVPPRTPLDERRSIL